MSGGMGGHQSSDMLNDEWLTPEPIIRSLGEFDLDPCSPIKRPWPTAKNHMTVEDNGLLLPWYGRVWLNPPYGDKIGPWLNKMALHGNGIALMFARVETNVFFDYVWPYADAILFRKGRLTFHYVDGRKASANGGAPNVFIAYGKENVKILKDCDIPGAFIELRSNPVKRK